jgi:hypothetical protein
MQDHIISVTTSRSSSRRTSLKAPGVTGDQMIKRVAEPSPNIPQIISTLELEARLIEKL